MWNYEEDDELKNKLKYDIIVWYKSWYMGNNNALNRHLELFDEYYDPGLFDDKNNLSKNIIDFMTMLQNKINKEGIE